MIKEQILPWVNPFIRPMVAGADVSDLSIKFLKFNVLGKRELLRLEYFSELEIPKGVITHGEIKKEDELIGILRAWHAREKKKIGSTHLVISLPEEKSYLRLIQIPKIKREEVMNAIRWEIEANIPLPLEELIYDYEIIEPIEDHLDHFDVEIVAFPKILVEPYVKVFREAGFRILALELESQAIMRAVIPKLRERMARIILDIGRTRTSFTIYSGGSLLYTSTIELGGKTLEENIKKALGVDDAKALVLKEEHGLDKHAEEGKLFAALLPALAVVADELRRAVEYYQNHIAHLHGAHVEIDEILLVGGDANLYGLTTYLSSALKIPTVVADMLAPVRSRLRPAIPIIPKQQSLSFATTIGLALRTIRQE